MFRSLDVVEGLGDNATRPVPSDDAELRAVDEDHVERGAMLVQENMLSIGHKLPSYVTTSLSLRLHVHPGTVVERIKVGPAALELDREALECPIRRATLHIRLVADIDKRAIDLVTLVVGALGTIFGEIEGVSWAEAVVPIHCILQKRCIRERFDVNERDVPMPWKESSLSSGW